MLRKAPSICRHRDPMPVHPPRRSGARRGCRRCGRGLGYRSRAGHRCHGDLVGAIDLPTDGRDQSRRVRTARQHAPDHAAGRGAVDRDRRGAYGGTTHESRLRPTRATGCAVRGGDASEMLELRINVDEARGTTKLDAESTVHDASGRWHCRYRFARTSHDDPGVGQAPPRGGFCGDGVVDQALGEECDGGASGTPCDGACTAGCTCPQSCEPLDVTGHWQGMWVFEVTGETGQVVADLGQAAEFVFGPIAFPPFRDSTLSAPFIVMGRCAPTTFSTGALLGSGSVGTLDGIATNGSLAGNWAISDHSDHGTWQLSR
jgi:hypothetical protein